MGSTASVSPSPASLEVGVGVELNGEPVPIGVNVNGFFSADSRDVVTGGVLGGLPKVKPTGLPMLPPEVPVLVADEGVPKANFVPVVGKPPNGDGTGLSLSKLLLPKRLVVDEDVGAPNPPNGLATFSGFVLPNPPNTLVVLGFSNMLDEPERDGVVVLSFSLSPKSGDPPNKFVVLVEVDALKKDPGEVELEAKPPNKLGLAPSSGGSSVDFFASEEAKKFGMVEEGLFSELVVLLKPNVGAGGPPEDSEVGAGIGGNVNPVGVGGMKLLGFEPAEGVLELSDCFGPDVLEGADVDNFGAGEVEDAGGLDKLGALKRMDGPGSGPRGRVFLGELLKEPASCLSHTDWIARRLAEY